jgi:hypothetical protein
MWDSIVNTILPILILFYFFVFYIKKHRLHQRIQWRNYRKISIQVLAISTIYFVLYLAPMTLYAGYSFGLLSRTTARGYYITSLYIYYFVPILIPFISTLSLSELRAKFKINFLRWQRPIQHIHGPQILPNN